MDWNETQTTSYGAGVGRTLAGPSRGEDVRRTGEKPRILLRPAEVAEMLGLGRSTVFAMLAAGDLPTVRFGRAVRVPVADLEEWIERRTVGATG